MHSSRQKPKRSRKTPPTGKEEGWLESGPGHWLQLSWPSPALASPVPSLPRYSALRHASSAGEAMTALHPMPSNGGLGLWFLQVVKGLKYMLEVEIGRTTCRKTMHRQLDNCDFQTSPALKRVRTCLPSVCLPLAACFHTSNPRWSLPTMNT